MKSPKSPPHVSARRSAMVVLSGLVAAGLAYVALGLVEAGIVLLATVTWAAFGRSIVGNTPVRSTSAVDPRAVRAYREAHPEATITEATAATHD